LLHLLRSWSLRQTWGGSITLTERFRSDELLAAIEAGAAGYTDLSCR
jgi:hypothetical protein